VEVVKIDKEARYCWLNLGLAEDWLECLKASKHKQVVIAKA